MPGAEHTKRGDHQHPQPAQLRTAAPKHPGKPLQELTELPAALSRRCHYDHGQKFRHGRSQARARAAHPGLPTPGTPAWAALRSPQAAGSRPTRAKSGRKGPNADSRILTSQQRHGPRRSALPPVLPAPPFRPAPPRPSAHSPRCERGRR